MNIKAISKSGRSRVLRVDNFVIMNKIINRFDRWEYVS
ncbi:hypothetical protein AAX29_00571 [Aliarcobacter thereius]|uniref:Uncharacterized protein n=1 Tax=Aliarcobacter thereius TaxID=544718 RepID=A0A1C0B7G3_9BACT|nr:hypothetical protein AAX29_00571 [Aliarcobacter thereius]